MDSYPNNSTASAAQMLGIALEHHRAGRRDEAETIYRQILSRQPDNPDALHLLGVVLGDKGQPQLAIELIGRAIALRPEVPDYHANLGEFLRRAGQHEPSAASFRHAIAIKPDDAGFHNGLGVTFAQARRFEPAIAEFRSAIRLKSDYFDAHNNLGSALCAAEQYQEALDAFSTAISLKPDYAVAHNNLGQLYLLLGDYQRGWAEFEWRLKAPHLRLKRDFPEPQWEGSDPCGKTILLHVEGGYGDAMQMIRLVPQVARRGAKLILECHPALVPLLEGMAGLDRAIARGQPLPAFDWQIPLQSLPHVLGITLENLPNQVPYLSAPPDRVQRWKQRLAAEAKVRVGLVWAGSRSIGEYRTRTVDVFAPLAKVPGFKFFSLQKGDDSGQAPPPGMDWADFTAELNDFADTAALVQNLDLVVTVDTSVAHLAGALAKPVWVLIPIQCDFRWMLNRTDSPWYPTMRLFRQAKSGDWEAPIAEMAAALRGFKRP